eukprot:376951-Rhodomonas_salina.2
MAVVSRPGSPRMRRLADARCGALQLERRRADVNGDLQGLLQARKAYGKLLEGGGAQGNGALAVGRDRSASPPPGKVPRADSSSSQSSGAVGAGVAELQRELAEVRWERDVWKERAHVAERGREAAARERETLQRQIRELVQGAEEGAGRGGRGGGVGVDVSAERRGGGGGGGSGRGRSEERESEQEDEERESMAGRR